MSYPAPIMDLQVQADGTIRDAVSGTNATITRAGAKYDFDPIQQAIVEAPANKLAAVRYPGGPGWWAAVEVSRTNNMVNSIFAGANGTRGVPNGYTDIFGTSAAVTASVQKIPMPLGEALRVRAENISGTIMYPNLAQTTIPASAGQHFTSSIYYRNAARNCSLPVRLQVIARDNANASLGIVTANFVDGVPEWQRATVNYPGLPTGTTRVDVRVFMSTLDPGQFAEADIYAPQFEGGTGSTSYIPTTAAAVTRPLEQITFPVPAGLNVDTGTMCVVRGDSVTPATTSWLLSWRAMNFWPSYLGLYAQNGSFGHHSATWRGDDQVFRSSTSLKNAAGFAVTSGRWANQAIRASGNTIHSAGSGAGGVLSQGILENVLGVGCYGGSGQFNGHIHRLLAFSQSLTDAELNAVVNSILGGVGRPKRRRPVLSSLGGFVKG